MEPDHLHESVRNAACRSAAGGLAWRRRQSLLTLAFLGRLRRLWQRGNRPQQWSKLKSQANAQTTPPKPSDCSESAVPGQQAPPAPENPEATC